MICECSGYPGFRVRFESATKTTPEALQPTDPGSSDVDPVPVAVLRGRQEF